MKKASKVLIILLVCVLVLGTLAGCDGMFNRNTEKYRAQVVMTVGSEQITLGKLIDTFNSYYNSSYANISSGSVTVDSVFESAVDALYSQYMKLDTYKQTASNVISAKGVFANQEYLTADELKFALYYVDYVLFTTMDSLVEGYMLAEFDLNDEKEEEEEDTSRDFATYDDLGEYNTYSEYALSLNFKNEEMSEYLDERYGASLSATTVNVQDYVFKTQEQAQSTLDKYNARLDEGATKITLADYTEWQQKAIKQYSDNVDSAYGFELDKLIVQQVEDFIVSLVVAKYNYSVYGVIDHTNLQQTITLLTNDAQALKTQTLADFKINDGYVKFIEGLTDTSYLYAIDDNLSYVFVKNILVPFSEAQKQTLTSVLDNIGGDDSDPRYIALRNKLASEIVAEDFTHQDNDGKNLKVSNLFKLNGDKLVINPDGALSTYFDANGKVLGTDFSQTVLDLMAQYNTDVAQHASRYDYVVRVGQTPATYSSNWVPEFVDAANDAVLIAAGLYDQIGGAQYPTRADAVNALSDNNAAQLKSLHTDGKDKGTYALAVSKFGVHIVCYSGNVTAYNFDFSANLLSTSTPEYALFRTYFDKQQTTLLTDDFEALKKVYYNGKITVTDEFDKFLDTNGISFDFEKSISLDDEEN